MFLFESTGRRELELKPNGRTQFVEKTDAEVAQMSPRTRAAYMSRRMQAERERASRAVRILFLCFFFKVYTQNKNGSSLFCKVSFYVFPKSKATFPQK